MQEDTIAIRLKLLIQKLGITNSVFADKCGIPRANLSQLLTGRNKKISDVVIRQIHNAYPSLSVTWLLFNEGEMWNGQPPMHKSGDDDGKNPSTDSQDGNPHLNPDYEGEDTEDAPQSTKNADDNSEFPYSGGTSMENSKENAVKNASDGNQGSLNKAINDCIKTSGLINEIEKLRKKTRKIVQITVYYDDSTFESYFPR